MVSVTDLQQFLRREKDSAIELQKKDTDSQKLLEEQGQVRAGKVIVKTTSIAFRNSDLCNLFYRVTRTMTWPLPNIV